MEPNTVTGLPNRNYIISGYWMDDGFIRADNVRQLAVYVNKDGIAYDTESGYRIEKLIVRPNGVMAGWGAGVTFAPDDGDLARCGIVVPSASDAQIGMAR